MLGNQVERTYHSIRQGILGGVYHPSERLVERDLAESIGVSRVSVRSALQRLHQEGLVTLEPHRGAKVTAISLEEALRIVEVREGLEGWAAALAARRISEEQLEELERQVSDLGRMIQDGRMLEYGDVNASIHQKVIEAAANPRLKQLIDGLKVTVVRFQYSTILMPGRAQASWREHSEILDALRSRSPDRAEDAMRRHIAAIRHTMEGAWRLMRAEV